MTNEIELTIDGEPARVPDGATLLEAAQGAGKRVPVICYFEHTTANGLCRVCVVENEEGGRLEASCVTAARSGASIRTESENVRRVRRTLLEMLAFSVDLSESAELQAMLEDYQAAPERFSGGEVRKPAPIDDNPMFIRDYAQCVLCWRCVQVCAEDAQYAFAINFGGRGYHTSIATFYDKSMTDTSCVFCGQCIGVCPTGALKAKREYLLEQGLGPGEIFEQTRRGGKRAGSIKRRPRQTAE